MSNRLKLSFALLFTCLLVGGCMPVPGDPPPLASVVTVSPTSKA